MSLEEFRSLCISAHTGAKPDDPVTLHPQWHLAQECARRLQALQIHAFNMLTKHTYEVCDLGKEDT